MSEARFQFIKNCFQVENYKTSNKSDELYKVRYFIEYIMDKWQENFYPGRDICIDETIIPYTSRHSKLIVYLRNKPNGRGYLIYDIAE